MFYFEKTYSTPLDNEPFLRKKSLISIKNDRFQTKKPTWNVSFPKKPIALEVLQFSLSHFHWVIFIKKRLISIKQLGSNDGQTVFEQKKQELESFWSKIKNFDRKSTVWNWRWPVKTDLKFVCNLNLIWKLGKIMNIQLQVYNFLIK